MTEKSIRPNDDPALRAAVAAWEKWSSKHSITIEDKRPFLAGFFSSSDDQSAATREALAIELYCLDWPGAASVVRELGQSQARTDFLEGLSTDYLSRANAIFASGIFVDADKLVEEAVAETMDKPRAAEIRNSL